MSTSDENAGKPKSPDKSKPSAITSDYIGLPKVATVNSYVSSVYSWFSGSTESTSPQSSGAAPVKPPTTAAATGTARPLAVHPSQTAIKPEEVKKGDDNVKTAATDAGSPQDDADIKEGSLSSKAPQQQDDNVQFSFMNQLRAIEDEKNKDFLIPDQEYFADPEKIPQVHKPNSTKMCVKPPKSLVPPGLGLPSLPTTLPSISVPDVTKVGTLLTSLITKKSTPDATQQQQQSEPKDAPPK